MERWVLHYQKIKEDEHDVLLLCFEGFDGVRVYEWGGANASTHGQSQEATGGQVEVHASKWQPDPIQAHAQLVQKMEAAGNTLLAFVPFDDLDYADVWAMRTRTDRHYEGVPLAALSGSARHIASNLQLGNASSWRLTAEQMRALSASRTPPGRPSRFSDYPDEQIST